MERIPMRRAFSRMVVTMDDDGTLFGDVLITLLLKPCSSRRTEKFLVRVPTSKGRVESQGTIRRLRDLHRVTTNGLRALVSEKFLDGVAQVSQRRKNGILQ